MSTDVWPSLVADASAPYRASGLFAWHWARGKLSRDPVFRHLLGQGLIAPGTRVLDIGCGQGLLASLLRAAAARARQGAWPKSWGRAPVDTRVHGIELVDREVRRARKALGNGAEFVCGDMCHTPFPQADVVVILDVMHYVGIAEQNKVLERARQSLPPGGHLLMRVADADSRRDYWVTRCIDAVVAFVRWGRIAPMHDRPLTAWIAHLKSQGFDVTAQPMSQGTPFANVLLVATKHLPTPASGEASA